MLLSEGRKTNSELAKTLNVSQAAVTKAVKTLVKEGMLEAKKDKMMARDLLCLDTRSSTHSPRA